jgi:hypothetical protein
VVRAARLESALATGGHHDVGVRARAAGGDEDPVVVAQLGERHRIARGQRVAAGQRDEERIVEQVLDGQALHRHLAREAAQLAQRDVELAALEHRQRLGRVEQEQLDLDRRALLAEQRHGLGHDRAGRRGERRHAQPPARLGGELAQLVLGRLELGEDALGVAHQHMARGGEPDPARGAVDERDARLALEPRDLLRHGRLGVVERLGGRRERSAEGDLPQDLEEPHVVHTVTLLRALLAQEIPDLA